MPAPSDFKRCQIISARMAGTGVTKTVELFGVPRSTVSKVTTALEKERKTASLKQNFERNRKLSDKNR